MAGVKGRSGGKRTGAGRKAEFNPLEDVPARPERVPSADKVVIDAQVAKVAKVAAQVAKGMKKAAEVPQVETPGAPNHEPSQFTDPKDFLVWVMNNPTADGKVRVASAVALMPYTHKKVGEQGKKEEKQDAAGKVASKFARREPPRIVAANGKEVG